VKKKNNLNSLITANIPSCLLCGKCLEVCPVFNTTQKEEFSPRAKAFLINQLVTLSLDQDNIKDLIGKCVGCGRCADVCTQHIDISDLLSKIRSNSITLKKWIYSKVLEHIPELSSLIVSSIGVVKDIPSLKKIKPLQRVFSSKKSDFEFLKVKGEPVSKKERAVVFGGCVGTYFKDSWVKKAYELGNLFFLMHEEIDWNCCGYPFFFAGFIDKASEFFKKNFYLWKDLKKPKILVFCSTCYMSLKKYSWIIEDETERKEWVDSIILLSNLFSKLGDRLTFEKQPREFVLHKPCHMDEFSYDKLYLFFKRLGIKFEENRDCCGFGGSTRLENPWLCDMLAKKLWDNIKDKIVVSGCSGCIIQLTLTNPKSKTYHWLDLIDII